MAKFTVNFERKCVIDEVASYTIEAKTAAEARALAKVKLTQDDDGLAWEPCDTNYTSVRIDDVEPA